MGNKVVVKGGSSKELTPHSLFFSYTPRFNKIVFCLALALLKASSNLSEAGTRTLIESTILMICFRYHRFTCCMEHSNLI
jgi:hypothetical protein